MRRFFHGRAIEAHDYVSRLDAVLVGGRVPRDAGDEHAFRVRDPESLGRARGQLLAFVVADRSAPHFLVLLQVAEDLLRQIARYGEADALIAAALREDDGVDA